MLQWGKEEHQERIVMKKLLQQDEGYRWDVSGITFAIPERVGDPRDFIGRVEEMEYRTIGSPKFSGGSVKARRS